MKNDNIQQNTNENPEELLGKRNKKVEEFLKALRFKIFLLSFIAFITSGILAFFIAEFSIKQIEKNYRESIKIFNECNLNSKSNIGCIAYIDNLRRKENFDYDKPLKELNGLSVKEFEKKYHIVMKDPDFKKVVTAINFHFNPKKEFVEITDKLPIIKRENDNEWNISGPYETKINKKHTTIFYLFTKSKISKDSSKKTLYTMSYIYSPVNYKGLLEKGFQFIGSFNSRLKNKRGKLEKLNEFLTLEKKDKK